MSQTIECPGCGKRFRLGDRPPATYTCNQCSTVMDLTDFGGKDRAPAQSAPAAPASRSQRRRGAPSSRSAAPSRGAPSRRGAGARSSRGRGRSRGRDDYDDYDDRRPRGRPQKSNAGLMIVLGAVGIAVLGVIIALMNRSDPIKKETADADDGVLVQTVTRPPPASGGNTPAPATDGTPTAPGTDGGSAPGGTDAGSGGADKPKPKRRMGHHNVRRYKLETFPWSDEVDEATRAKVEEAITAMYRGDRQSREAQDYLVSLGRVIGGRLVSEFHTISNTETFESREGRVKAGQIDQTLRKMDGWMERHWKEELLVRVTTPPDTVLGFAKRWTVWWKEGYWKSRPLEPWDPMVDSHEEEAKSSTRKKRGKKGWDKR